MLAAMVAAGLAGLEVVVRPEVVGRLETQIDRASGSLQASLYAGLARLSAEARVVAEEPRLKAVVHQPGVGSATQVDVAEELRQAIGWDVLGLAGAEGERLALVGAPGADAFPGAVEQALATRMAQDYWLVGDHLYQTVAVRIAFGDRAVGALLGGVEMGDARAEDLHQAIGFDVAFLEGGRLVATSVRDPRLRQALSAPGDADLPAEMEIAGETFLVRQARLGSGEMRVVILHSKEEALAPYVRARRALLALGAAALLAAAALAAWMARGLARRVGRMAEMARSVATGNLDVRMGRSGVTELDQLAVTFNDMVIEVGHQRRRDELAGFLVHDLKSPLGAILLQARMLADDQTLARNAREGAQDVVAATETVLAMVLDLLDVASSADGHLLPRKEEVDLVALLSQVCRAADRRAALRGQLVLVRTTGPQRIQADRELLRRVLDNLLDNSFKYSPAGGTITLECRPPRAGMVEIRVSDEGPGVPEEMRERIFDKYFRLDVFEFVHGRVSRGLGLVFCRAAVEAHGGHIRVLANAPRGSTFLIELPVS